jgi:DNA-binding MarR family transcriptional regulator
MTRDLRKLGDPGSEAFHLEAYPFYLLNRAVSRYNVVIEAQLRRIAIDIPTWRVLMILGEEEPRPIAQVASCAVINISTMARIVDRMLAADLIRVLPSRSDGRVTRLALTAHGRRKLAAARRITAPVYRKLIKGFSARSFGQMLKHLNRLHDNLGPPAATRPR